MSTTGDLPNISGPGVSRIEIPELTAAAREYHTAKDARVEASKVETTAKKLVKDLLKKHVEQIGRGPDLAIRYSYDDRVLELIPTEEKLFDKKAEGDEGDGNEE